jgi:hypothetical protein
MPLPSSVKAVLKRRDSIITEAKSVIRLPQLTGALRSAPLGEFFLFQDYLEEAIKIQKSLDPIPTKAWAKKQTTSQVQSSYSGRDFQGGFPIGQGLWKMLLGTLVPAGGRLRGVRGDKRVQGDL